jgi:hypothetical protein
MQSFEVSSLAARHWFGPIPLARWRVLLATLLVFPAMALAMVLGVLNASKPPEAPADVQPGAPLLPRIAERVALIIVDGLRYDVATDPSRMPLFARAMQEHLSGESWAGTVTMTSSAVMAYGTGQRGGLEQVIRNLHAEPVRQNSWIANAHHQGLSLMTVGELAWPQLYSKWLRQYRQDPDGVAIDVDFNAETFAGARELSAMHPDFLVVHFVTPDHQGHAYRVTSQRYADHVRDFDQKLSVLLSELGPSWTVIVTSDHGAADSGTHGTDTAIQRRSPIYAYGPGIVRQLPGPQSVDQLDLSVTLPLLLGVTPPAHGMGRALVKWLDLPDEQRAEAACENARRVVAYAERVGSTGDSARQALRPCLARGPAEQRIQAADQAVVLADRAVSLTTGLGSRGTHLWVFLIASLGALAGLVMLPKVGLRPLLAGLFVFGMTIWLVATVERFPGIWPNVIRAALFVAGNSLLLALLIRPRRIAALFERYFQCALLLPLILAVTYPADTRPQSVVAIIVIGMLYVVWSRRLPLPAESTIPQPSPARLEPWLFGAMVLALLPVVVRENNTYSVLLESDLVRRLLASGFVVGFLWWFHPQLEIPKWMAAAVIAFAVLPQWLRPFVGPWIGRGAWLFCAAACIVALLRGRGAWSILFGLCGVLWLARDFEVTALIACVGSASIVGGRLSRRGRELSRSDLVLSLLFGFSLMFALRMALQDGLEFGGMDWGAAGFNDRSVSDIVVGAALVYKHGMCAWLIAYALGAQLGQTSELRLMAGLACCMLGRSLALSGMFFFAGNSYWTALRVLGDMPTAAAMALGCLAILAIETVIHAAEPGPAPPRSASITDLANRARAFPRRDSRPDTGSRGCAALD